MALTWNVLGIPFENPFDDSRYSHEDYNQFSIDTQGKFTANLVLSGITQIQLDNYGDALLEYQNMLGSEANALGNQKGSTNAINDAWNAFVSEVRRKEGLVKSVYGKTNSSYMSFFPQGLTPYSNTARGKQLTLINHILTQFTAKVADFPGVAASFTTLKTAYLSASSTQSLQKGTVSGSKSGRDLARLNLANNHHEIWLTLAIANMGKSEQVKMFYNVSIFDKGTNYDNDGKGILKLLVTNYSGEPLVNAPVTVKDQNGQNRQDGTTDDNGFYESGDLLIGFYDVLVSFPNYLSVVMQYQVFDNRDPLHEIKLTHE